MHWSRRDFLLGVLGAGTAALYENSRLLARCQPPDAKHYAMVMWFAHNICEAAYQGHVLREGDISDRVRYCADHGINSIYFEPRYVGAAVYHSKVIDSFKKQLWIEGVPGFTLNKYHPIHANAIVEVLDRFDPYDVAACEVKRLGLKFFAQVSIFDHHFPILPSSFYDKHPELLLLDRSQKFHFKGVPCYAEQGAQDYCLAEIRELIDRGADGICLAIGCHQVGFWPSELGPRKGDSFGFNPPLVEEYQRRYGVNVLKEEFDQGKWHALHAEFFTRFLTRVKKELKDKSLVMSARPGYLGYGGSAVGDGVGGPVGPASKTPAYRLNCQWQQWFQEDIVDGLRVYAEKPNNVADVEAMKQKNNRGNFYFSRWIDANELQKCRRQIERVQKGPLDGFVLHEDSHFQREPKLWTIFND